MELVSVIIPTYNRIDALYAAVKSVVDQTYPYIEIIVVDDGSTDPRASIMEASLQEIVGTRCSLQVITLKENLRKIYNKHSGDPPCQGLVRNCGLDVATGVWVAFLDDDDKWIDQRKLEKQLDAMNQTQVSFCISNMTYGNVLHHQKPLPQVLKKHDILHGNPIPLSTSIVKKDILILAGKFRHVHAEDWDCWKRVMDHTDCVYIDEPMVWYDTTTVKHYNIHKFD